uniref:Uncharacterized protein n=1 Tax=Timema tahoe TaxID=61484 RepID=A0A7R9FLI4_9NEOP|nr:unnamed protein product [Timema tahoe]
MTEISVMTVQAAEVCRPRPAANHRRANKPNPHRNRTNSASKSTQNNSGQNVLNSAQSSGGSNPGSPPNSGRSSPDSTHNDSTDLITPEILAGSGGSGSKNVDCAALVASIKASIDVTKRGTPRKRKKYILSPSQRRALKLNILKQTHGVHQPCENCRKKCVTKITQERRVDINKQFWDLGWMERRVFILNNSTRAEVKRHRGTKDIRKRTNSFNYYLKDQKGERHGVCKTFFLTTLGFSKHNDTVLHNVLCKTEPGSIVPKPDMRGKHVAAIRQKQKSNSEKLEWLDASAVPGEDLKTFRKSRRLNVDSGDEPISGHHN